MTFKLPDLPYAYNALEPYIDEQTMRIHHTKHHQAYVDNLNKAVGKLPKLKDKTIEDTLKEINDVSGNTRQSIANHGGGHANHSLYWKTMSPKAKKAPEGKLAEVIDKTFSSLEKFKDEFTNKAMGVFGSGWAFLIASNDNELSVKRHSFQNSPLMHGNIPLVGIDVWEHAYYLKYQNRRLDYINAWWNVLDWTAAEEIFNTLD